MATSENPLNQLETLMSEYLIDKAPYQIPKNAKESIAKFLPWIIVVLMVISLPALLALIGFGTAIGFIAGPLFIVGNILTVIAIVLEAIALPGLFKQQMAGWKMLFYSNLVSLVGGLLGGNAIGALIFSVLSFYVLFQIRSEYK